MRYHLDTIPVWDVMKSGAPCPICALRNTVETRRVEYYLGGSVMEPDVRIRINRKGFCCDHQRALLSQKNKLGLALLMLSHADETLARLEKTTFNGAPSGNGFRLFKKNTAESTNDPLTDALLRLSSDCVICDDVKETMNQYLFTFLHLLRTDPAFKSALEKSNGLCVPDIAALLTIAREEYSTDEYRALSALLLDKLKHTLLQDRNDLEYFTQKFDYRNADKPWGNSKDALERTINLLQGACVPNK